VVWCRKCEELYNDLNNDGTEFYQQWLKFLGIYGINFCGLENHENLYTTKISTLMVGNRYKFNVVVFKL